MPDKLRGVLQDIDGTLVDSNDYHAHAWMEAIAEAGCVVSFAVVRRAVGMGGDHLLPEVAHWEKESPQGKKASRRRGEIFKAKYLSQVKAFPQTRQLLERMKSAGLKLVVASSSEPEEVQALLKITGADTLTEAMSTAQDAGHSKPAPQPVQVALQKAGLKPGEALMLGDTPYDIEAASKAGVQTIALRSGGWTDAELKGALAVYQDPADLLAHFEQSPFAC